MDEKEKETESAEIHFNAWYDKEKIQESKALLVGVFQTAKEEETALDHLSELDLLARTHRIPVVDKWCTLVREFSAATFLSSGKVSQLKDRVLSTGANVVIFDDEITPVQQRNLETALRMPVMDRTEVILGVFADRAKTREAKLQIEMAQVKYIAPRLKRMWLHLSRQTGGGGGAGGGGYLRGKGEKQIEMDRRALKRRMERLQDELDGVARYRQTQRSRREKTAIPVFAIIGYTNAGKSTLMNSLTHAHVYVEDMLFATLDTTTRQFVLPNNQPVLLVDTVGFIRKLPHLLVAAFKSTLEESVEADVLIHLIDSSHPMALEQAKTTFEVLSELNAKNRPIITVINKIDLANSDSHQRSIIQKLRLSYPRAIQVSALTGEGFDLLFNEMVEVLKSRRKRVVLKIPQSEYSVFASAIREGTVFTQTYVENDIVVDVELPLTHAQQLAQYIYEIPQEQPTTGGSSGE
jgi:GTP-binding protein HflX